MRKNCASSAFLSCLRLTFTSHPATPALDRKLFKLPHIEYSPPPGPARSSQSVRKRFLVAKQWARSITWNKPHRRRLPELYRQSKKYAKDKNRIWSKLNDKTKPRRYSTAAKNYTALPGMWSVIAIVMFRPCWVTVTVVWLTTRYARTRMGSWWMRPGEKEANWSETFPHKP